MRSEELWNDFCFQMKRLQGCDERTFQYVAENIFEKFGWVQYKDEIISQQTINIGSARYLKPDIIIQSDGKRHFVVELKKANAQISDRNKEQLFSYMRMLRLRFGILIGSSLQIFYESEHDDVPPVQIIEIPFNKDNKFGMEFMQIIAKDGYSAKRFQDYCENKLKVKTEKDKAQQKINQVCSIHGVNLLIDLLKEQLAKEISIDTVAEILQSIEIRISKKNNTTEEISSDETNEYTIQQEKKGINKAAAIALFQDFGLVNNNTTFASVNKTSGNYWANPDIALLEKDWFIILNNNHEYKLILLKIPANTFYKIDFLTRADRENRIDLNINPKDFTDTKTKKAYSNFIQKTVIYKT